MEDRLAERALPARGGALRLHLRGRVPPTPGGEGPKPRHRLVRPARPPVAPGAGGLRGVAFARELRLRWAAAAVACRAARRAAGRWLTTAPAWPSRRRPPWCRRCGHA